jgi:RNA polymerase sigma-70 factor (ECF subfamily)
MARAGTHASRDFPTTSWTDIRDASAEGALGRQTALEELLRRYWPALWAHLVYKKRVPLDKADDLVQSFVQEKILERNLLGAADPAKGKFRTFLLTALDRFLIDCWRKEQVALDATALPPKAEGESPSDVFDLAWAMQVLVQSVGRLRAECESKRRADLWGVFAGRALAVLGGAEPIAYKVLAEHLELHSDKQAANRYAIAEAMFHRNFRAVLAEYAGGDVEAEARDFLGILCEAGPELLEQLRIHLWKGLPEITMTPCRNQRIDRAAMARLLELPDLSVDAAGLLEQILKAPIPLDLGLNGSAAEQGLVGKSLSELLHSPSPVPEVLELLKDFAKENRTDPESPLGREVATVLYFVSIAVALVRCDRRITRHDDATLRQGFRWGVELPWLDEPTRGLLREGLQRLRRDPDAAE